MNTSNWDRAFELSGADDPAGLTAGVARAASQLALTQSATYNVDRALSVGHTLNLTQSDYWIEGASSTLALTHAAPHVNERPRSASSTLTLTQGVLVSGGQTYTPIQEIIADGVVLVGQVIYIKGTGHAATAQADAAATAFAVGIAAANGGGVSTGPLFYRTQGQQTLDDWTNATGSADLTPGSIYYVSAATDGEITATPPSGDGEFVVKIGTALNARTLNLEIGEGVAL